eukprot:341868-Pleurochrysis_carterae.AAC.5
MRTAAGFSANPGRHATPACKRSACHAPISHPATNNSSNNTTPHAKQQSAFPRYLRFANPLRNVLPEAPSLRGRQISPACRRVHASCYEYRARRRLPSRQRKGTGRGTGIARAIVVNCDKSKGNILTMFGTRCFRGQLGKLLAP